MASASASLLSIFLFFILLLSSYLSTAASAELRAEKRYRGLKNRAGNRVGVEKSTHNGNAMLHVAGELWNDVDSHGVVRSTPARHNEMPSYKQGSGAPVPLPEFPTLAPPLVWSFPAAPLPSETPYPPSPPPPHHDLPVYPGTGPSNSNPPPPPPPPTKHWKKKQHCRGTFRRIPPAPPHSFAATTPSPIYPQQAPPPKSLIPSPTCSS